LRQLRVDQPVVVRALLTFAPHRANTHPNPAIQPPELPPGGCPPGAEVERRAPNDLVEFLDP
jgi:hypothetical protein